MNIATVSPDFPAVKRIFMEMEKQGLSKHYNDLQTVPDAEVFIIGAWWDSAQLLAYTLKQYKKRVWVLWTSPILQAELSVAEVGYMPQIKHLIKEGVIEYVLSGSHDACEYFGGLAQFVKYPLSARPIPAVDSQHGHVGLFGPTHYRKSILHQMLALKIFNYTLHTGPISPDYKEFAKSLGLRMQEHPWLPEDEFYKLVASMDFGLQCSVPSVESFSYMAFDYLQMDRPVIANLDWLHENWSYFKHDDIRRAIENLFLRPHKKGYLRRIAEDLVVEHNEQFAKVVQTLYNSPAPTA